MCGFFGVINKGGINDICWNAAKIVQQHRGPNSSGDWIGTIKGWNVALSHQRLAILDLTKSGEQPMIHPDTGSILVFNGEIYNFIELKAELDESGVIFFGNSDTEVLLQALEFWGVKKTLSKLNGMWAFSWVDVKQDMVYLSRDRSAEKPLYLAVTDQEVYFSSELKTLLTLLDKRQYLNYQAIYEFLEYGLLDIETHTMFKGIEQVESGSILSFKLTSSNIKKDHDKYWECPVVEESSMTLPKFVDKVRNQLYKSVNMRLRSDVPVGILLSGGLDSSSIAAIVKETGVENITLISLVSDDSRFDESLFIDSVAEHLGCSVTKIKLPNSPHELFDHLENATWFMDAPLGSFSNVAHFLLMKAANKMGITVVLSGQGGDELFCGYRKFFGFHIINLFRKGSFFQMIHNFAQFAWNKSIVSQFHWGEAARYLPKFFRCKQESVLGISLQSCTPTKMGLQSGESVQERQRRDLLHLSVPTLTHYEDRMSMAWSCEIRCPFLDPDLIELLVPAPIKYKLDKGWSKYALRLAMEPLLPQDIVWRKDKQGFLNPEGEWLKTVLKPHILNNYFNEDAMIFSYGIIDRANMLKKYEQYCGKLIQSEKIWQGDIFRPIALEVWLKKFQKYIVN
jgi:asparagine synthase (glutamine-hydrolysing)